MTSHIVTTTLTEEEKFFNKLRTEAKELYKDTDLIQNPNYGADANFAICDTPIQKGKDIIAGINWGDMSKGAQTEYPKADKDRNWRFLKSSEPLFIQHLGIQLSELSQINYTNVCFYRTKKLSHLTLKDWSVSLPLFKSYVEFIQPQRIILLGTTVVPILENLAEAERINMFKVESSKNSVKGYQLKLFGVNTYCVPHPQARVSKESRNIIWQRVFESNM